MRLSICWPLLSGYMAACWRALAAFEDVSPQVVAWRPDPERDHIDFDISLVEGLNIRLLDSVERSDAGFLIELLSSHRPELLVVPGWFWKPYREVVNWAARNRVAVVMAMDTSLRFTARQWLGRWAQRNYFAKIAGVYAPGERAYLLARWLGFQERQIRVGAYGFDFPAFENCLESRQRQYGAWPRKFLFVGRLVERKGVDTLAAAYRRYREQVDDPWALVCCGQGPLGGLIDGQPGVEHLGFVQPRELPGVMTACGAFVLPSRFEAWGVALAEAGAAGLPLIASHAVGASVEVLRDRYNGRRFATGDAAELADAMCWVHDNAHQGALLGRRSRALAEPFRAELWAERLVALGRELLGSDDRR